MDLGRYLINKLVDVLDKTFGLIRPWGLHYKYFLTAMELQVLGSVL